MCLSGEGERKMAKVWVWLLSSLLAFTTSAAASDLAGGGFLELEAVQYSVVIDSTPIRVGEELAAAAKQDQEEESNGENEKSPGKEEPSPPALQTITMTNKFGQKYSCFLPDVAELLSVREEQEVDGEAPAPATPSSSSSPGSGTSTLVQQLRSLLAQMGESRCLFYTKDWWTYELCYGKVIRQYHMEDGKPSGKILNLGTYNNDYEWPEEDGGGGTGGGTGGVGVGVGVGEDGSGPDPKHHSQFYANGTECDLTGNMRKTEVKFYCDPDTRIDYIGQVDEPLSCEYIIHVYTNRICKLPKFRPPPQPKPKEIKCHPLLSDAEYSKFEAYQKEREKLEEINRRKANDLRKQRMLELVGDDAELVGVDVESEEGIKIVEKKFEEKLAERLVSELGAILTPEALKSLDGAGGSVVAVHKFIDEDDLRRGFDGGASHHHGVGGGRDEFMRIIGDVVRRGKARKLMESLGEPKLAAQDAGKEEKSGGDATTPETNSNLAMERKVRSEQVSEEDLINEYGKEVSKMSAAEKDRLRSQAKNPDFQKDVRKELKDSLEDIIAETEREVGAKLSLEGRQEVEEAADDAAKLENLWKKLENIEKKITKVNSDLSRVQDFIDDYGDDYPEDLDVLDYDELPEDPAIDPVTGERLHYKHDGTSSVKRELREEEYFEEQEALEGGEEEREEEDEQQQQEQQQEEQQEQQQQQEKKEEEGEVGGTPFKEDAASENVRVKVTDMSPQKIAGLKDAAVADRVTKRLESVIKSKLSQAGLDTGGRHIEVKLVTSSYDLGDLAGGQGGGRGGAAPGQGGGVATGAVPTDNLENMGPRESQQFQDMIYNLITGNQEGFNDIDSQRKSERNYKFQWDDSLLQAAKAQVGEEEEEATETVPTK